MKNNVRTPCSECPFRRNGMARYTGDASPEEYALSILREEKLPCHKTVDYEDKDWLKKLEAGKTGSFCAGAMVMAANICKVPRDPKHPRLPADRVTVFSSLKEMVDAHRASGARSWQKDRDVVATGIREDVLRMEPLKE